ncbi:hypothetical protein MFIFM68171_07073 [Madurella fahalii]|uniref:Uncharacterized protein n=1 Tax=Madurella fahalii TaxID=1157608 RepID=A0ABQ0GGH1_9PEZI
MVSVRLLAVAFAAPLFAALTPQQIVDSLQVLTTKSQALQAPAQSITIINGPLIVIGLGPFPQIITGFGDIVSTATTAAAALPGTAQITTDADATAVADAFREFVRVHQVLLNILIGKAGLFQTVPVIGAPVAAALPQVEAIVDTVAFAIADLVDPTTQKQRLYTDRSSLKGTLTITVNSYDGLSLSKVKREFRA